VSARTRVRLIVGVFALVAAAVVAGVALISRGDSSPDRRAPVLELSVLLGDDAEAQALRSAERAYEFGMVNDLCEPGEAFDRALALAERITVNAPLAVRKSRELALHTLGTDEATGFKLSGEAMIELSQTEDFWEGPKAFIEKRDPVWQGK